MLADAFKRQPKLGRFLAHLFQRTRSGRLGLVTGAGISVDAGVPSWRNLLTRLSERSLELQVDLQDHMSSGLHPEYLGQIIYHRLRDGWGGDVSENLKEAHIDNGWAEAIHDAIYKDVEGDINSIISAHPYLAQLRNLCQKVSLVINFNFDDLLSDAMGHQSGPAADSSGRPFSVVWRAPLVERHDATTIYHVNGLLPREALKKRSPQLIFTEDSFAAAAQRSPSVSAEYLFLRFIQNTMLLLGTSLSDNSLKNYLRKNKTKSPANHHYMIQWISQSDEVPEARRHDIFLANLELYNVITIFLTSQEINELLRFLNMSERDARDFLDEYSEEKRSRYHYYIVGPVASGKSSLIEQLRCFGTFEEWTRSPPREMYRSFSSLSPVEQNKVDDFVYRELKEKNRRMDTAGVGLHFMDRAPLDLYAFSATEDENIKKTRQLREKVTHSSPLRNGMIIFLHADGDRLVKRNLGRGRVPETSGNSEYLSKQATALREVYSPNFDLDTGELDAGNVAQNVARFALLETYEEIDFSSVMERYEHD